MSRLLRWVGRGIGLDVHRDFCEIAICEDGVVRSAGRVATTPEAPEAFAASLSVDGPGGAGGLRWRMGGRAAA